MTRDKIRLQPLHPLLLAGSFVQEPELQHVNQGVSCLPAQPLPAATLLRAARPQHEPQRQPAPPPAAIVGLRADQQHPSTLAAQPRGAASPPSRWPAVGHSPGTVPALAFNCWSDLRGERCSVGAVLGTGSPTMDGDPAQCCSCLGHPGMTCPLHPRHASYGLRETDGSGDTGTCRGVLLPSARTRCPGSWRWPAGPQDIPHTLGRDTALGLAEPLWDRDVPIAQLHSITTYPQLRGAFPLPHPQRPWASQAMGSRAAPKGRLPLPALPCPVLPVLALAAVSRSFADVWCEQRWSGDRLQPYFTKCRCSCDVLLQYITGMTGGRTTNPAGALHQGI